MSDVKMIFLSVEEVKDKLNVNEITFGWSHRGKLCATAAGTNLRVQQSLDSSKDVAFMYAEGTPWHEGCFVNVDRRDLSQKLTDTFSM